MECDGPYPTRPLISVNKSAGTWMLGEPFNENRKTYVASCLPFRFTQDMKYDSSFGSQNPNMKAMYNAESPPLMRDDLIEALREAGVENLELFPAEIEDPGTGDVATNYKAFNIIGLVACSDMDTSEFMDSPEDIDMIDVDFSELVIDESKAQGLHLFRLAECCSAIVISETVRNKIEEKNISGMVFYGPGEWSG
jgi:hypothetical protein